MSQEQVALCLPAAGFILIQIIKFIKLSIIHEVLLALCISIPYIFYCSPKNIREIGTQTDTDVENAEQNNHRNIIELIKYFLINIFKIFIK